MRTGPEVNATRSVRALLRAGIFSTLLCLLASPASQPVDAATRVTGDRGEMLVGEMTEQELYRECPVFKENAAEYAPDKKAVAKIQRIKEPLSVLMFLGTWCGDSMRESPKLLKILDASKNPRISFKCTEWT